MHTETTQTEGVELNFSEATFHVPEGTVEPNHIPTTSAQTVTQQKEKKRMLILHLTTTDPAGAGYNLVRAINQYTPHTARILTTVPNVYGHPTDIGPVYDYYDEVEALLIKADVIHFHKVREDFEITLPQKSSRERIWRVSDFLTTNGKKKKVVYHVHGHPYERAAFVENAGEYKKRDGLVLTSTPDLERLYKPYCNANYFPNCVPIWHAAYLPRATNNKIEDRAGQARWVVGQTVSDPKLKDAEDVEAAVAYVGRSQPVNYMRVENVPHIQAMRMKRICHVLVDHMQGYYGLASLEGFAMGKPVIAGLDDYCIRAILDFFKIPYSLPWQIARNLPHLKDTIMDLVVNEDVRNHIGKESRKFMEEVWSDESIGKKLAAIYEAL